MTYRVYRLDPNTGTYKLLTGAGALTTASFTDGGLTFDASNASPRTEIVPLPTGSLTKWTATSIPQLTTKREGLDGVVIAMDPATSGNLVGRILVAGGRDGTGGTAYTYHKTAESLGIYMDGTLEATWSAETPIFTHARAYYALLTTQNRNTTPFPPPPEEPPNGGGGVIFNQPYTMMTDEPSQPGIVANVVASTEPVYVVAVMGDDAFAVTQNAGRYDFEACQVDPVTGRLACNTTWTVQNNSEPVGVPTFGHDATLYFSFMYPFAAISRETTGNPGTTIQFINAAIGRFPVLDLMTVTAGQIVGVFESASTSFNLKRAYYQMTRLLAYVYVVGGYADTATPGPTDLIERHQQ